VGQARTGRDALALLEQIGADILLTDIVMPGMDGLALTEEVRRRHLDIQIILLTLYRDFDYARAAIRSGVQEYLLKGVYREADLGEALQRACAELERLRFRRSEEDGTLIRFLEGQAERPVDLSYPFRLCVLAAAGRAKPSPEVGGWLIEQLRKPAVPLWRLSAERFHLRFRPETPLFDVEQALLALASRLERRFETVGLHAVAAAGPIVRSDDEYRRAHREALRTTKTSFYKRKRGLADWDPAELRRLSDAESLDWTLKMRTASGVRSDLERLLHHDLPDFLAASRIDPADARSLFARWLRELKIESTTMERAFDFAGLVRGYLDLVGGRPAATLAGSRHEVDRAILHLKENLHRQVSLAELAEQVGLSANYLGTLFRQCIGKSFKEYLNQLRMEHAAELVTSTNLKIYQVAHRVGIANYRYFSTLFHRQFGLSPRAYRRQAG
jgi:two-component system response regulator YesN